jgi:hypothetical protein
MIQRGEFYSEIEARVSREIPLFYPCDPSLLRQCVVLGFGMESGFSISGLSLFSGVVAFLVI